MNHIRKREKFRRIQEVSLFVCASYLVIEASILVIVAYCYFLVNPTRKKTLSEYNYR